MLLANCSGKTSEADHSPGGGSAGVTSGVSGTDDGAGRGGTASSGGTTNRGGQAVEGGAPSEQGGADPGAVGGAGGEPSTGGVPPTSNCSSPRIVELFAFDDSVGVVNSSNSSNDKWLKGAYDSTDTKTGNIDATAVPPANPTNLANMSTLDVYAMGGDPAPAMRYRIPFSPSATKPEVVELIYIFAAYGKGKDAVDVSNATLKASVKLASAPNSNCIVTVHVWTTGTDPAGQTFHRVDGPQAIISADKWVNVQMNLGTSMPATAVNQYGFSIRSSCSQPEPGAGGAGGASGEGGPTVLLIDNIVTVCK